MPIVSYAQPVAHAAGLIHQPNTERAISTWINPNAGLIAGPEVPRPDAPTPMEQTIMDIHVLTGPKHSEAGQISGHFLKTTGPAAFSFQPHGLGPTDVGALPVAGQAADSDKLDGNHASAFLGASATAVNSDKLDGSHATAFLGATAQAVDSDKLDGYHASAAPAASAVPLANATGTIAATWLPTSTIGPAASITLLNTGFSFDAAASNVIVNPYPTAGWAPANYGGSTCTRTFQTVNAIPEMLLTSITQVASYPRVVDTAWTPAITADIAISFEAYSDTNGAALSLCLYASGSTKHLFPFTLTTGWKKYTGYVSSSYNIDQPYFGYFTTGAQYHLRRIQVEAATAATGFFPGTRTADDLVIGQNIKLLAGNTLTVPSMTPAGLLRNTALGLLSGGHNVAAADLDTEIGNHTSATFNIPRYRGEGSVFPTAPRYGDLFFHTVLGISLYGTDDTWHSAGIPT